MLVTDDVPQFWSQRAREQIAEIRVEYSWLPPSGSAVLLGLATGAEWWTYAGSRVNGTLAAELARSTSSRIDHDDFALTFEARLTSSEIEHAIGQLRSGRPESMRPAIDDAAIDGLKFSECLPKEIALEMLERRLCDEAGIRSLLAEGVRFASYGSG